MGNFKELRVWQDAVELAEEVYKISKKEPFSHDHGLSSQIQRAAVSISSNIAEGDERGTNKQSSYFLSVAKGSSAEVITQLYIAHRIGYIDQKTYTNMESMAQKIRASLRKLIIARENR